VSVQQVSTKDVGKKNKNEDAIALEEEVREVFIVHVGGTRCVTSSIDRIIQIHARITWGVVFIRAIFFIFFFYV
jgi:hypothetical protein